jgi:hypothetical protein
LKVETPGIFIGREVPLCLLIQQPAQEPEKEYYVEELDDASRGEEVEPNQNVCL